MFVVSALKDRFENVPKKILILTLLIISVILLSQLFLVREIRYIAARPPSYTDEFPITVDPQNKIILVDQHVEAYLQSEDSPLEALALFSVRGLQPFLEKVAIFLADLPVYENLALVNENKIISVPSGLRKEQVADLFAKKLSWDKSAVTAFLNPDMLPSLEEGMYVAGTYVVDRTMSPVEVRAMIRNRFDTEILSRYTSTIAEKLPLETTLTIASLIQRETIGTEDMREVSGVIWNRIFKGMNLQLDATLQYAKASTKKTASWWPTVLPKDKYIASPYNTYKNSGLPPGPIASPSVAAVVAALNPIKSDCLYYFHDTKGDFHCSATYPDHVALLKKLYGRGK